MQLSLVRGFEAETMILDPEFRMKWDDLLRSCPWATAFQSFGFVDAWYRSYRHEYEPCLVTLMSPGGDLLGLLPLAVHRHREEWVVAGGHQCEYQLWISLPQYGDSFITMALKHLFEEYRIAHLPLTFVPSDAPLNWTLSESLRKRCMVQPRPRTIMLLGDGSKFKASLRKKHTKSRLNRLKRLGPVMFERITGKTQLAELLPELQTLYDFRLGAVYGVCPFKSDRAKHDFHLAMMEVPELLHVTLLKAGDQIVAFHMGVCDQRTVHAGILAYSPFEAALSPAALHVLLLGNNLAENGFSRFDLTPGQDSWKERMGDHRELVYAITVFSGAWKRRFRQAKQDMQGLALRTLQNLGVSQRNLQQALRFARHRPIALLSFWARTALLGNRLLTFRIPADAVRSLASADFLKCDYLADLLAERSQKKADGTNAFLLDALKRIEAGQHFYTFVREGQLLFCGWQTPVENSTQPCSDAKLHMKTPNALSIQNFFVEESFLSAEFLEAALGRMTQDAISRASVEEIYLSVPGKSGIWMAAIEGLSTKHPGLIKSPTKSPFKPLKGSPSSATTNLDPTRR